MSTKELIPWGKCSLLQLPCSLSDGSFWYCREIQEDCWPYEMAFLSLWLVDACFPLTGHGSAETARHHRVDLLCYWRTCTTVKIVVHHYDCPPHWNTQDEQWIVQTETERLFAARTPHMTRTRALTYRVTWKNNLPAIVIVVNSYSNTCITWHEIKVYYWFSNNISAKAVPYL